MEKKRSLLDRIADWLEDKPKIMESTPIEPELSSLQQVELIEFKKLLTEYARLPFKYSNCQDRANNIYSFVSASTLPEEMTKPKIEELIAKVVLEKIKGDRGTDYTYSAVKALTDRFDPKPVKDTKPVIVTLEGRIVGEPNIDCLGLYSYALGLALEDVSGFIYFTYRFQEGTSSILEPSLQVLKQAKQEDLIVRVDVTKREDTIYTVVSNYQIIRKKPAEQALNAEEK
ncbi:MAG: hypothetical protein V2A62_04215 [Candidatus Woesearchaeota archaeon]